LAEGATLADLIAVGQCMAAIKGNTMAAHEIADRVEGKLPKPVALEVGGLSGLAERIAAARKRIAANDKVDSS
jgi:hypothetical protein